MKKFFFFAASALMLAAFASCTPDGPGKDQPKTPEVKTAAENLVVHLPLESAADAVKVGAGISADATKGAGSFAAGFIGKGYTNSAADNNSEAFLKLKLAAGNAFTKLESMTFSCWVKLPAGKEAKGALISFNGTGVEDIWPSFVYLFDNFSEEAGQQFNGRIDFLSVDGKPAMWPNAQSPEYAKKDVWFHVARTYDASTGAWANFANGVKVNDGVFTPNDKVVGGIKAAFASDCNALYVGAWASRVEGKSSDAWQNYFCGSIDEIRFFNKALSETEINALYKEELAIPLE